MVYNGDLMVIKHGDKKSGFIGDFMDMIGEFPIKPPLSSGSFKPVIFENRG